MEHSTAAIQPAGSETYDLSPSPTSDDDEDLILTPTSSTTSESPTPEVTHPALIDVLEERVEELDIASAEGNETEPAHRANATQNSAGGKSGSWNVGQEISNSADTNVRGSGHEEAQGHLSRLSGGGGIWIQDSQATESPQAAQKRRFVSDGVETRIVDDDGIRVVAREDDDEIPNISPSSMSAQSVRDTVIEGSAMPDDLDAQRLESSTQSSEQPRVVDEIMSPDSMSPGMSSGGIDHSTSPGFPVGRSDLVDQSMPRESYVQCSSDNSVCNNENTDNNNAIVSSSDVPSTGGISSSSSSNRAPTSQDLHFSNNSSNSNDNISIISHSFSFGTSGSTSSSYPNSHNSNSSRSSSTFSDQTLSGRTLNGATIRDCCITACSGRDLRITDCTFSSCNFSNATIKDCSFSGSSLQDCVKIVDCSFSGSSLHNCVLRDYSFNDSHVSGGSRRDCTWNRSNVH